MADFAWDSTRERAKKAIDNRSNRLEIIEQNPFKTELFYHRSYGGRAREHRQKSKGPIRGRASQESVWAAHALLAHYQLPEPEEPKAARQPTVAISRYSINLPNCSYCDVTPEEAWIITDDAVAIPHPSPLTACHVVVAPRRHVLAFYELDVQEQRMVWNLVADIQKRISSALKVDGFDVGFADGSAEDPVHAHIHVVPRPPGETLALPSSIEWVDQ